MNGKRVVFKVNRPSWQAKSNIVEKTFDKQKDIEMYFINTQEPDGLQVYNMITGYIATILKVKESEPIIKAIDSEYSTICTNFAATMKLDADNLPAKVKNQLYASACIQAYHKANDFFDRIYRGRGNELKFGCVVEDGYTPDGKHISISEEYFDDIDSVEDESKIVEEATKAGPGAGVEIG